MIFTDAVSFQERYRGTVVRSLRVMEAQGPTMRAPNQRDGDDAAAEATPTVVVVPNRIRTGLEGCGLAAADTATILSQVAAGADIRTISRDIASGQILQKRSGRGRRHVLAAVRRRYLDAPRPLPRVPALSMALGALASPLARHQLLLPYLLLTDQSAHDILTGLVLPRLPHGGRLAKAEVVAVLDSLFVLRGQKPWSETLRKRWAEGLLSVLRDAGALGRGRKREELQIYSVRPEVFSFHLWGLYEAGFRGSALCEAGFWRALLLDTVGARRMVGLVSEHGWWRYTSVGGTEELLPVHGGLMEWLSLGLG